MVTFKSCRSKPELVVPARSTPRETRALSDVDNQPALRFYTTIIEFFRRRPGGSHRRPEHPAKAVKAALAEALVHYHPIAGRLRELPECGNRLVVDCTAEGAAFVEAHADVRLEELGAPLVPPYPCVGELMCDVGDTRVVVGKPLLFMQMTCLRCGGFVITLTMCHSVADAFGMVQLLRCVVELARGAALPTTLLPTWERHLLTARAAPRHRRHAHPPAPEPPCDDADDVMQTTPLERMVSRSFLFGPGEIAAMRSGVPGRSATAFDLITAVVWRCWTAALAYAPDQRVRVRFASNARGRWKRDPPLPPGFYGNALFSPAAEAAAGELCGRPLAHALELVREAKFSVTDEYVRSELELMAGSSHHVALDRTFMVSDLTRCGDDALDFGWAERAGGGVPMAGDAIARLPSYYMRCINADGEDCVVVPVCLPGPAMERFAAQIAAVTSKGKAGKVFARSSL